MSNVTPIKQESTNQFVTPKSRKARFSEVEAEQFLGTPEPDDDDEEYQEEDNEQPQMEREVVEQQQTPMASRSSSVSSSGAITFDYIDCFHENVDCFGALVWVVKHRTFKIAVLTDIPLESIVFEFCYPAETPEATPRIVQKSNSKDDYFQICNKEPLSMKQKESIGVTCGVVVSFKIHTLSSQHQRSPFVFGIKSGGQSLGYTAPIKVVSKKLRIDKRRNECGVATQKKQRKSKRRKKTKRARDSDDVGDDCEDALSAPASNKKSRGHQELMRLYAKLDRQHDLLVDIQNSLVGGGNKEEVPIEEVSRAIMGLGVTPVKDRLTTNLEAAFKCLETAPLAAIHGVMSNMDATLASTLYASLGSYWTTN